MLFKEQHETPEAAIDKVVIHLLRVLELAGMIVLRKPKPVATLQLVNRSDLAIALDQEQFDIICSLVEMADDATNVTFGDWTRHSEHGDRLGDLRELLRSADPSEYLPVPCKMDGCEEHALALGLCGKHLTEGDDEYPDAIPFV